MQIMGEKIVLRHEKHDGDIEDAFRWINLEEWQYYDEPDATFHPISRRAFEEQRQRPKPSSRDSGRWEIDTREGEHVGWVSYYKLDEAARIVYVGLDLPEEHTWGLGYGTEALQLWIDYLFDSFDLIVVRAATWSGNLRMMRCAEKCGLKEMARLPHRADYSVRGERLERIEFAVSRSDWKEARENQETEDP